MVFGIFSGLLATVLGMWLARRVVEPIDVIKNVTEGLNASNSSIADSVSEVD